MDGLVTPLNAKMHLSMTGAVPGIRQPGPPKFLALFTAHSLMPTCYGMNYAPPSHHKIHMLGVLTSSTINTTIFEDRVFTEVIKLN